MNHIYKKSFYTINKSDDILKKIELELKDWGADNIIIRKNIIEFSFSPLKIGSTFSIYRIINHGIFELYNETKQTKVKYTGFNHINVDVFALVISLILSIATSWFFLFLFFLFSIQLSSRISNLNKIQSEMIKRLSENENVSDLT